MKEDFSGLYTIRSYKPSDQAFVISTWLRGMYYGESWFSLMPKDIFMYNYKKIAEKIMYSPDTIILLACLPDDPDVILGYSIINKDASVLHWTFVKKAWRNKGIGRSLLPKTLQQVTHLSDLGRTLLKNKLTNVIFNPFAVGA